MTEKANTEARYIFKFSFKHKQEIKMWRIDPTTKKETELDNLSRGSFGSFVWTLEENSKTWVSVKIDINKLTAFVKEFNGENQTNRYFQVLIARNKDLENQDLTTLSPYEIEVFADKHEMEKVIRVDDNGNEIKVDGKGKNWVWMKKNRDK